MDEKQYNKQKSIQKINKRKLQMDFVKSVVEYMSQENVQLIKENVTSAVNLIILLDIVQITNNYTL